jgi:hypothetical protein
MASDDGLLGVALVGAVVVVVVALLQRAGSGAQAVVPVGSGPAMSPAGALQRQTGQRTSSFGGESSTAGQSAATDSGSGAGGGGAPDTITQEGVEVVPNSVAGATNPADVVAPIARSMKSGREPYRERSPGDYGQIV